MGCTHPLPRSRCIYSKDGCCCILRYLDLSHVYNIQALQKLKKIFLIINSPIGFIGSCFFFLMFEHVQEATAGTLYFSYVPECEMSKRNVSINNGV